MLKTNRHQLVEIAVAGEVATVSYSGGPAIISQTGQPRVIPRHGGIVYNVRVGDSAFGWEGDHIEPGVSLSHPDRSARDALGVYGCIGNPARVLTGRAKGARGVVTGKHGVYHLLIDFPPDAVANLQIGDRVQVRALGVGLCIEGFPGVAVKNIDPGLLEALGIRAGADHKLEVPVAARVPAELVGSGSGELGHGGDIDIQTADRPAIQQHGLETLRLGDIIALDDCDSAYGVVHRPGAVTVGIVAHCDSFQASHGPGVVPILCSWSGEIELHVAPDVNIATLLGIGSARSTRNSNQCGEDPCREPSAGREAGGRRG
jgi:hypothetical protein